MTKGEEQSCRFSFERHFLRWSLDRSVLGLTGPYGSQGHSVGSKLTLFVVITLHRVHYLLIPTS